MANRKERRARGINVGDTTVKFSGRTLEIRVVINTDESAEQVAARAHAAAKGPKQRMCVITAGEFDKEAAERFWSELIPAVEYEAGKGGEA
jgi:hypothetical protein